MRLLVELSGENVELAGAECRAVACSEGHLLSEPQQDGRALVIDTNADAKAISRRLALAWSLSTHILTTDVGAIVDELRGSELPGKCFRVKVERLNGSHTSEYAVELASTVGAIFSGKYRVDLVSPDVEVRILLADKAHVGLLVEAIDRSSFESRKSEYRPYSHPISLHPKLARALVNLTGVREGQCLLDPFCGTGGVLLEAALMGVRTLGGDMDSRMVSGTRQNLEHYGI
ncbi:MAG: TIGR01177 family methyltransferase, partial [Thermoplasmata archaeon]|nr:TIGR01177 family methyltransferase [Thermoplasmata archaeon]